MTRLAPPPRPARLLDRPRLDVLLAAVADFPLTLVTGPAGSGKTTALAALAARGGWPTAWCRVDRADDPPLLLRHLAAALRGRAPLDDARFEALLEAAPDGRAALDLLINALAALDDETLLVLDDYHHADRAPELRALAERLVAQQPVRLHLVLLTREEPLLAPLPTIDARGELYRLTAADLAFTPVETQALFRIYGLPPHPLDAELTAQARGWPLALRLIAGALAAGRATPDDGAARVAQSIAPQLDDYLDHEVLAELPPVTRTLLLGAALLRWIDADACAATLDLPRASPSAHDLERRGLFVEQLPDGRRTFQPLPHASFTRQALRALPDLRGLHRRLADYYAAHGDDAGAVHHLLATDDAPRAAEALGRMAAAGLTQEGASALLAWLDRIPEPYRSAATMLEARAAAERRVGRFTQAAESYRLAVAALNQRGDRLGQARALRGWAEVYLDTVQPAPATDLLRRALKLLPRALRGERAENLRLQAENWANRGRADVAIILERAAQRERQPAGADAPRSPEAHTLPPRLLLRSGQLHAARSLLSAELGLEPRQDRAGTLHRDPLLLLALIETLLGNGARALAVARRGLLEAQRGGSPLAEAIAHMRLGHAYQLVAPHDEAALRHYRAALAIIEAAGVERTHAEGLLGLTLHEGHAGDLAAAEAWAAEGLRISAAAGDEWTAALIQLALGGAAAVARDPRAPGWLEEARQRFARGADSYGQAATALWLAHWHLGAGDERQADRQIETLLDLAQRGDYVGLLTAPTLFGPRDQALLLPLLLRGRALRGSGARLAGYARHLLRLGFPSIAADDAVETYHPGFTLRVQLLGSFRIWRGQHEILGREWQREKARQLLQLLLTHRGSWLQREQICAWLWPESDPTAAERQFKVTLNALNTALEPQRPPRVAPFFIRRQGLAYSFAPSYGCWVDVDEFELRTAGLPGREPEIEVHSRRSAFQLYRGDFLAEALYDPWTIEERERLLARHLASTTSLAGLLADRGETAEAIELCEQVIRRDRGYEEAYQVLMAAHARGGSRSQALRAYTRAVHALADELGIEPLPETTRLAERIRQNEPV